MKNTIRTIFTVAFVAVLGGLVFSGCGSSSSPGASVIVPSGNEVTLSGSVQTVSVSSNIASLQKGISKDVINVATQCANVKVYQLTTGNLVGEGVCNADGTFTITMYTSDMQGEATDEVGDSFTFRGVIVADDLLGYVEATYTDGTTTITADTVSETTLSTVMDMLTALGISDISDLPTVLAGLDPTKLETFAPKCFWKLQNAMVGNSSSSAESPINAQIAKMKGICNAASALISLPSAYTNWGQFMKDCMHGGLSSDIVSDLGNKADAAGLSGSNWATNYATTAASVDAMYSALSGNLAGGAGLEAVSEGDTAFCQSDVDDSDAVTNLANTFLNAGTVAQFTQTFGSSDGMKVMLGTIGQYKDAGNWDNYDPEAIAGVYQNYEGVFTSFFSGSTLDTGAIGTVYNYVNLSDPKNFTMTYAEKFTYFASMAHTFISQGTAALDGNEDAYVPMWMNQQSGGGFTFTELSGDTMTQTKACMEACFAGGGTAVTCGTQCRAHFNPASGALNGVYDAKTGTTCAGGPDTATIVGTGVGTSGPIYSLGGSSRLTWSGGTTCSDVVLGNNTISSCTVEGTGDNGTKITIVMPQCNIVYTKGQTPAPAEPEPEPEEPAPEALDGAYAGVNGCQGNAPFTITLAGTDGVYSGSASTGGTYGFTWTSGVLCSDMVIPPKTPPDLARLLVSCGVVGTGEAGTVITMRMDPKGALTPPGACDFVLTKQ